MDNVDSRSVTRQEGRFFHSGITTANDNQSLVAKCGQRAITRRACRDAIAAETLRRFRLAWDTEPLCRGAGSDNQRFGFDDVVFGKQRERAFAKIDLRDPFLKK